MKQLIKTISILFVFGVVACTGKKTNTDQPLQTVDNTTLILAILIKHRLLNST